jgi:hypothetical protein
MPKRRSFTRSNSAFNDVEINALNDVIHNLYIRRTHVGKLALTFEEYLNTFVPEPAREIFVEAAQWVYSPRYARWELLHPTDGSALKMTLSMYEMYSTPAPPLPRQLMIQPNAPQDVVERVMQWVVHGGDVSRDFGRVRKVLDAFNNSGFSRLAIRYYWPTLLALLSEGPTRLKDMVPELQDLRRPPKLPPLPPGLQRACRETAETISTARLIPADIDEPEPGEVMLDIVSGQIYDEPIGEFEGMC